ncbi:MAG: PIG-L deacetylase family protein [Candidatus Hodarchaeota archaeon]
MEGNNSAKSSKKYRVLAIEAHPDDLVYFYGGTVAKLASEGHQIRVITVTKGDQSTMDPAHSEKDIERIMAKEHAEALEIIGVKDQEFLEGFTNHFIFSSEHQLQLREILIKEIREFRPDTVITFDQADIFEENPDHRLLARVGTQAAAFSAYPLVHPEHKKEGLEPHFVGRVLHAPTIRPNLYVDIGGEPLERKIKAGAAYKSQLHLMITEMDQRLRTMGLDPDLEDMAHEDLWEMVCESMAEETAKYAVEFYKENPELAPEKEIEHAEAFRMYFLGAVDKLRDYLPKELLTL